MAPRRGGGAWLPLAAALLLLALAPHRARGLPPPGGGAANATTEGPPAINNTAIHGLFHALHGATESREHPELGWREFREVLEAWHAAVAPCRPSTGSRSRRSAPPSTAWRSGRA